MGAGVASLFLGLMLAPRLIRFLIQHQMWRKKVRTQALGGGDLPVFTKFHGEGEVHTPRFGGVLVWLIPPAVMLVLGFLTKTQTILPVAVLLIASFVGFLDDFLQVAEGRFAKLGKHFAGGLEFKYRFTFIAFLGLVVGYLFVFVLGGGAVHIPGLGYFEIGWWFVPFFALVMLATYSGGVIDGIDGLAGGSFALMFSAFGAIAFFEGNTELAALCAAIVGALLSFLWFNIPPAKFYMGEAGVMGLTATLTVVAMLTNSIFLIPVIGILLVVESGSVIVQLVSKKLRRGKKVFLAAPIHHHFEAKGWAKEQITMRFWIIGIVAVFVGIAIRFLGYG